MRIYCTISSNYDHTHISHRREFKVLSILKRSYCILGYLVQRFNLSTFFSKYMIRPPTSTPTWNGRKGKGKRKKVLNFLIAGQLNHKRFISQLSFKRF